MAAACIAHSALRVHGISKPVIVRFDQPHASSDGGAILLKAVDDRLGLTWQLASALPRRSAARQGGAPAPGSAASTRVRAGLRLRRLQRRRAADRRPDPQAVARPQSARRGGLGIAADAVAVRERRGPRRPLSARDGVGRHGADPPPRAPGRWRPAHHARSRCDRRPKPRAAGVRPLQRLLRHVVLSAFDRHGDVQHQAHPARRGRSAATGHRGGDPGRPRAAAPAVPTSSCARSFPGRGCACGPMRASPRPSCWRSSTRPRWSMCWDWPANGA